MADELLPALLDWLTEPVGPAIDNLSRAERLGGLACADTWLERQAHFERLRHPQAIERVTVNSGQGAIWSNR